MYPEICSTDSSWTCDNVLEGLSLNSRLVSELQQIVGQLYFNKINKLIENKKEL